MTPLMAGYASARFQRWSAILSLLGKAAQIGAKTLKIGLVWQSYYPWDVRIEKFARALRDAGHEPYILSKKRPGQEVREEVDGVAIRRFELTTFHTLDEILSYHFPFNIAWTKWLTRVVQADELNMLIVRDIPLFYPSYLVGRRLQIPVGLDMAENYPAAVAAWGKSRLSHYFTRSYRLLKIVERVAVRRAAFVLVVTPVQVKRLTSQYGIASGKIVVVSNTPDLEVIQQVKSEVSTEVRSTDDPVRIVYTGGLGPHRGIETLIRAVNILWSNGYSVRLRIIGSAHDMTYEERLRRLAKGLKLENIVVFTGQVPHRVVYREIAAADICVIPHLVSEHVNTTIPNKLFDYMGLGKPCVVSDAEPLKAIVLDAKCGLVFQSGDEGDLARVLARLIDNPTERLVFGRNGAHAVQTRYNWEADKAQLLRVVGSYRSISTNVLG